MPIIGSEYRSPAEFAADEPVLFEMLRAFRLKALERERIEIARLLDEEALRHEDAAAEMQADGDDDQEAWMHNSDAAMLRRFADVIRARTPAPEPIEEENIAF